LNPAPEPEPQPEPEVAEESEAADGEPSEDAGANEANAEE